MAHIPDKVVSIDKPIITGYPLDDIHAVGKMLLNLGASMNPTFSTRGRLMWNLGSWLSELEE
jgi:hypothetical protein